MRIDPGMAVDSTDGEFGKMADVVVDPVGRRLTHFVVQPSTWLEGSHLIPVGIAVVENQRIRLARSIVELMRTPVIEKTDLLEPQTWPHPQGGWDVGVTRTFGGPYYPASDGLGYEIWSQRGPNVLYGDASVATMTYDMIPEGTAEIRRASIVVSSDGHRVGHVGGMLVDPDYLITHLVVTRRHLWGLQGFSIPINEIASIETDRVRLGVTRDRVASFPLAHIHGHRKGARSGGSPDGR